MDIKETQEAASTGGGPGNSTGLCHLQSMSTHPPEIARAAADGTGMGHPAERWHLQDAEAAQEWSLHAGARQHSRTGKRLRGAVGGGNAWCDRRSGRPRFHSAGREGATGLTLPMKAPRKETAEGCTRLLVTNHLSHLSSYPTLSKSVLQCGKLSSSFTPLTHIHTSSLPSPCKGMGVRSPASQAA